MHPGALWIEVSERRKRGLQHYFTRIFDLIANCTNSADEVRFNSSIVLYLWKATVRSVQVAADPSCKRRL